MQTEQQKFFLRKLYKQTGNVIIEEVSADSRLSFEFMILRWNALGQDIWMLRSATDEEVASYKAPSYTSTLPPSRK